MLIIFQFGIGGNMTIDLFVAHILLQTEWHNSLGYAEPIILRVTEETHACELSSESHTTLRWSP